MRALVTGATGFLGRALVRRLESDGVETWQLSTSLVEDARQLRVDVADVSQVERAFDAVCPTHVFHLAAIRDRSADPSRTDRSMGVNLTGTMNVAQSAQRLGVIRMVVMGTADEYGCVPSPYREDGPTSPQTAYGISKLAATRAVLKFGLETGLEVCVLRATVAYGPEQPQDMFVAALLSSVLSGQVFLMTSGEQLRDFVYVDDVIESLLRASKSERAAGRILNIGTGVSVPVRIVGELVEDLLGHPNLIRIGALSLRDGEVSDYAVDVTNAADVLEWRATVSLTEGLQRTVDAWPR